MLIIILPIHRPLKGPEYRGCWNNTRTDTLTFLWNPSQSFFFEHFSTKTPLLAFKLLLTFHGFASRRQKKLLKYLSRCHILWSLDRDTFQQSVRLDAFNTSLSGFHRLRKWSPSLHIIFQKIFPMERYVQLWFVQTFFILISPLILLNSERTHYT